MRTSIQEKHLGGENVVNWGFRKNRLEHCIKFAFFSIYCKKCFRKMNVFQKETCASFNFKNSSFSDGESLWRWGCNLLFCRIGSMKGVGGGGFRREKCLERNYWMNFHRSSYMATLATLCFKKSVRSGFSCFFQSPVRHLVGIVIGS